MSKQWSDGVVFANGIKLHYTRTGGDGPPLILAHGFTDNGLCWRRLARDLESGFDVIMVDARAHGLSDAPDDGYTHLDHAADLAGLIRALDLEQVAIIGHSMGASTAASLAADYPELIRCAILEDPPWRSEELVVTDEQMAEFVNEWRERASRHKSMSVEEIIADGMEQNPRWPESVWPDWAESKRQFNLRAFGDMHRPPLNWQEFAVRIRCPVLLITGENELGAIVTQDGAAEAIGLLTNGEHVPITGAGHSIRREQYEPYLEAVTSFLKSTYE